MQSAYVSTGELSATAADAVADAAEECTAERPADETPPDNAVFFPLAGSAALLTP